MIKKAALVNDPIYGSIPFTFAVDGSEVAEKDILDDPWMQRLRQIFQLQSTRWVFPGAEHTRFQHSMGSMYLASKFVNRLYPSLKEADASCPEKPYVEELTRLASLLHNVGHGPFGHICDQDYLTHFNLNHQMVGEMIIKEKLAGKIRQIRRSPFGEFQGEIDPENICFLIRKYDAAKDLDQPQWLKLLHKLFFNMFTMDNLDHVLRDSYYSGFSVTKPDIDKILFYSYFKEDRLVIHEEAVNEVKTFIETRLSLYKNLYYNRTVSLIDLQIKEVYRDTIQFLMNGVTPDDHEGFLENYRKLTDWNLLCTVQDPGRMTNPVLCEAWQDILGKKLHWGVVYDNDLGAQSGVTPSDGKSDDIYTRINQCLADKPHIYYKVDMAAQDPRPETAGELDEDRKLFVEKYDRQASEQPIENQLSDMPMKLNNFRIYINKRHESIRNILVDAIENANVGKRQSLDIKM